VTTTTPPTTAVTPAVPAASTPTVAEPQVTLTARAAGLAPLGDDLLWPFGEPGACLVQVNGVDELIPVDCDEPHDLQRFFVGEISTAAIDADASFDAEAVAAATSDECRTAFEAFVGIGADASEFAIAVTRPSAETWPDGDRRFQCLLGVEGAWLVGDAAGSRQ
jgi:hypothetical protein